MGDNDDRKQRKLRFLQLSQNERDAIYNRKRKNLLKLTSGDYDGYEKRIDEHNPPQSLKRGDLPRNSFNAATISRNRMARALEVWNNIKNQDVVFVKMESKKGAFALTFGKDARKTAKTTGDKTKNIRIGRHNVEYVQIPLLKLKEVTEQLSRIDLQSTMVNNKGRQTEIPQPMKTAPAMTRQMNTPKMDIENSLDKNRSEKREKPLVIESLSINSDERGNWKISGVVNGLSVTAKNVAEEDVAAYKNGVMDKRQLVTKYHLDKENKGRKVETKPVRKHTMTRKYSLEG